MEGTYPLVTGRDELYSSNNSCREAWGLGVPYELLCPIGRLYVLSGQSENITLVT